MSLSVEKLLHLLEEDRSKREDQAARKPSTVLQKNVQEVWQKHGVLAPLQGSWKRPIPDHLYQCSLSAPQTTLATLSSLPRSIRSRLPQAKQKDEVVEVPLAYIQIDEEGTEGGDPMAAGAKKRQLGGNLSNKLSEYTRGVSGQCRPFRAGGLGTDETTAASEEIDSFLSQQAVKDALEVLEKGSEASWKDGTIIKAPPGVDFKVGLSWDDVHGKPKDDNPAQEPEEPFVEDSEQPKIDLLVDHSEEPDSWAEPPIGAAQATSFGTTTLWTAQDFLDDDSLFGSSDGGDSDSDEIVVKKKGKKPLKDMFDDSSDSDEDGGNEDEQVDETQDSIPPPQAEDNDSNPAEVSTDAGEVDELLLELSLPESGDLDKKQKTSVADNNNPLELAERQSRDQQDSTRKSWANTKLLPIDDINAWIPNPAMTFPFALDGFQQQAIVRLERNESVFVAAHTSAGKTVVAEYAVALARQRATRCIYTSPIKALSNQKFRDFSLKFGAENVGLITGDMQINADDSSCIIMTTEILRSMLYRGADLIRDIEWVIFDEVHYINDTERGVVWEEVIIMLPAYVNLVFLSATTPNTIDFSDWIGRTKRKPVHVVRTDYRPVPLSHHIWAGLKLHKILEGKGGFLEKGYAEAATALLPSSAKDSGKKGSGQKPKPTGRQPTGSKQLAWQAQGSKQNWMSLVRYLDRELLTPTVVFSFSKKKCEEISGMLRSLDLNTAAERGLVKGFTLQTRARLSELDSKLPQVLTLCEMVERGIGVHHGGLLPILKEMVEILFSRNLIKVLFATETFAMGVNMPARSVVFNSIRKHDGTQFRTLQPGEYVQMAGRAGRRGLDTVGTVILCAFGTEPPPMPQLRNMLTGQSTLLKSQFRLTYNMILNLLRVEEMSVESMIKRSFSEFAAQRALTANEYPKLLARGTHTLKKLDEAFQADTELRIGLEDVEPYFAICSELLSANNKLLSRVMEATTGSGEGVLQPGRLVLVTAARKLNLVRAPALVLRVSGRKPGTKEQSTIICLALLPESYVSSADDAVNDLKGSKMPAKVGYIGSAERRYFHICEVGLGEVFAVTSTKHKIEVKELLNDGPGKSQGDNRGFFAAAPSVGRKAEPGDPFAGMKSLGAARGKTSESADSFGRPSRTGQGIDEAMKYLVAAEEKEREVGNPIMDLKDCSRCGGDAIEFHQLYDHIADLLDQVRSFASHRHPGLERVYTPFERKETLRNKVDALRHLLSNESLNLFPDFLQRKQVLMKLGYVDENETVCVKGRVACEVNTCDELIATELVFEGILNDLEPPEIVAALSSLVFQEKNNEDLDVELPETLRACCTQMKLIAKNLGVLQKACGLEIDPLEYCDNSLKFGLVHVVYEWALGVPFAKICELTLVQEGSIVRCMTRLDELCREIRNCSRVVGNPSLYRKMEICSVSIKRDIVFASSLYVS
ncbi:viralicidic activity 2-like 2 [Seminavis robusta]|uniref:Viralicidic activity 2-like 2 n=1 Tax=Seminavis robusta TaxID=568900 RepID=A0A9N8E7S2_9STRA|nr:viralicidic activity 2-like 2 [Seminavis robusta]|eukprot:Sro587_g171320.1 viralicidic activity 2-like 2 (1435) ;mRNA; r:30310-35692